MIGAELFVKTGQKRRGFRVNCPIKDVLKSHAAEQISPQEKLSTSSSGSCPVTKETRINTAKDTSQPQ